MNRQIFEEASRWFVDFRTAEADSRTRHEFMCWMRRSPEHIQAYLDVASTYARLPLPTAVAQPDIDTLIERTRSRMAGAAVLPLHAPRTHLVPRRRWMSLAATLAVIGVGVACAAYWLLDRRGDVYVTQIGEQRSIVLPEGSRVELNARSRLRVKIAANERTMELIEGQALFDVARDAQRAFVVRSEDAVVRALGTRFDVRRRLTGTTVTVLEGRVAVTSRVASRASAPVELGAGEQTIVTLAAVVPPSKVDPVAVAAWTQHQLEFNETRLADVVEEFNRHSRRPFVIEARALEEFRITGVYSSADPTSFIRFLRLQPGFSVAQTDSEIRVLAH